jgi:6-pyruvoyltetrahydropterin/6-carboxytetrahydropterin synthase
MPAERFRVRVTKDHLVFCCGHFISYEGHQCERLHGHNYRAAVEIDGPLHPDDYYVFDFVALKKRMKEITDELDHHMLLATQNPVIIIHDAGQEWKVTYKDRFWVFPKGDCFLLPIENTTAELIARYLAYRLLEVLRLQHGFTPEALRVEVEENIGQSALFEWRTAE